MFSNMFRLRTLRLSDNNLICDCQLSWLARFLRHSPRLNHATRCFSPNHLKGQNVADLHDQEFKCSGQYTRCTAVCTRKRIYCLLSDTGLVERSNGGECINEPQCPHPCRCADGIVDCREKALTKVPDHLPDGITELWVVRPCVNRWRCLLAVALCSRFCCVARCNIVPHSGRRQLKKGVCHLHGT